MIVARDTRRIPTGSVDPTVKNFHWGDLVRGLFEAYDRDAWLPILLDGDGLVSRGRRLQRVRDRGRWLLTPARGVLEGITRQDRHRDRPRPGMAGAVGDIPASALYRAQEIFLTSTAGGVMPVATLDGQPVGEGRPGPMTTALRDRYWELHRDPRYALPVSYD